MGHRRFESTESYYAEYRPEYGEAPIQFLAERFDLDRSARVLDLGCGAGQITIPLSEYAGTVVGLDPNKAMLAEARGRAEAAEVDNVEWVVGSDAELVGVRGPFRLTTMGRSFHWMDQDRTLEHLFSMTEPGGGIAILTDEEWLTRGTDGWQETVHSIADSFLPDLPQRKDPAEIEYDRSWTDLVGEFGFRDVEERVFSFERQWTVDGIVGYVFSLSYASPKQFGDDAETFERELRDRLDDSAAPFTQTGAVTIITGKK